MSLTQITSNALSGLNAAQAGMRATSNNISNLNTPGYARQEAALVQRLVGSAGSGVNVAEVRRVTDRYLTAAAQSASANSAAAGALRDYLDRAQASFGDPASETSVFNTLSGVFSTFAQAAADPSSSVRRTSALGDISATLAEFERLASDVQGLRGEADARLSSAVDEVNLLLTEVVSLNGDVARGRITNDASGAENARAQVLDRLSELLDVRVISTDSGAVEVRTQDGVLLVGQSAATLSYRSKGLVGPDTQFDSILVTYGDQAPQALAPHLKSGEIIGLLRVRDVELPAVAAQVGSLAASFADALNAAHNDSTAYPAPTSLTGRNTGLLGTDTHRFTGVSRIAILGSDGALVDQITLDFNAGTATRAGGGAPIALGSTVQSLTTAIDGALAAVGGSASFTNGQLRLTGGANGLALAQDPSTPSARDGRGFGHVFGLNDLITSTRPISYETGLQPTDTHGFGAGQSVSLRLVDQNGKLIGQTTVTPATSGATMGAVVSAFNATGTGLGDFGLFALDGAGSLSFTPSSAYPGARLEVVEDTTQRGGTGLSLTRLFGVNPGAGADRATTLSVRADINADPRKLALGGLDLVGAAIGDIVTGSGDGAGGAKLQAAGSRAINVASAGGLPAMTTTILDYAGRVAGDVGRRADAADRAARSADTLRSEASARRASVEGVNVDEELVLLTQFQQAYNASSRLIQAAKEMTDVLLSIV